MTAAVPALGTLRCGCQGGSPVAPQPRVSPGEAAAPLPPPPPACDLDPGVWVPSSRSHLMSNWEHSGCKYSLIRPGSRSLSLLRSLRAPVKGDQGTAGSGGGEGWTPGCCWVLGAQHRPAPLRTDCFVQGGVSWTVGKLRQGRTWGDPVLGRRALSWCGSSGGVLGVLVASHTCWVHPAPSSTQQHPAAPMCALLHFPCSLPPSHTSPPLCSSQHPQPQTRPEASRRRRFWGGGLPLTPGGLQPPAPAARSPPASAAARGLSRLPAPGSFRCCQQNFPAAALATRGRGGGGGGPPPRPGLPARRGCGGLSCPPCK